LEKSDICNGCDGCLKFDFKYYELYFTDKNDAALSAVKNENV